MKLTFSSPSKVVLEEPLDQQPVIRIITPWYRAVPVEAGVFGAYNVQFAATLEGSATRLYIAAFPEVTKKFRDSADRAICPLSGSFDNQQQVIEAWENGFVIMSLDGNRPNHLARAVLDSLMKTKQAERIRL